LTSTKSLKQKTNELVLDQVDPVRSLQQKISKVKPKKLKTIEKQIQI